MILDVVGQSFGKLRVVARSPRTSPTGALWRCQCECGGETTTTSYKLRTGHTASCGCEQRRRTSESLLRHGHSAAKEPTYRTWKEMHNRCRNPKATQWRWYGGKGVRVCERWSQYECFLLDMGSRPFGKTLDRIDPAGNYEPSNCRWATAKEQAVTNSGVFRKGNAPWNKKAA